MVKTRDVELKLGVKSATLRKYALALEGQGYVFKRDANGRRLYTDTDVVALEQFYTLQKHNGMTVETAAKVVVTRSAGAAGAMEGEESTEIVPVPPATSPAMDVGSVPADVYEALLTYSRQQEEHNRNQAAQIAKMHKRMDDQNAHIAGILKEVTETRRMIAAQHARKWWQPWKRDLVLPDLNDPEVVLKLQGKKF